MHLLFLVFGVLLAISLQASPLVRSGERLRPDELQVSVPSGQGYVPWEVIASRPEVARHSAPLDWLDGVFEVEALPLESLVRALGGDPERQTVVADCADGYQSHFSPEVMARAKPVVVLRIDGKAPAEWPRGKLPFWPGPYFITVLPSLAPAAAAERFSSHKRPFAVTHLRLIEGAEYLRSASPAAVADQAPGVALGRTLFLESCSSCHNIPAGMGGSFAQRNTLILATYAQSMPQYFDSYVRNPKAHRADARMPGQPEITDPELEGLRAYLAALHPPR